MQNNNVKVKPRPRAVLPAPLRSTCSSNQSFPSGSVPLCAQALHGGAVVEIQRDQRLGIMYDPAVVGPVANSGMPPDIFFILVK